MKEKTLELKKVIELIKQNTYEKKFQKPNMQILYRTNLDTNA